MESESSWLYIQNPITAHYYEAHKSYFFSGHICDTNYVFHPAVR
jgi:hypothetical protein